VLASLRGWRPARLARQRSQAARAAAAAAAAAATRRAPPGKHVADVAPKLAECVEPFGVHLVEGVMSHIMKQVRRPRAQRVVWCDVLADGAAARHTDRGGVATQAAQAGVASRAPRACAPARVARAALTTPRAAARARVCACAGCD
jgi:hypothetical protein